MKPADTNRFLFQLARAQHGLVTIDQMTSRGITEASLRARVANNTLERLDHGIYRITAVASSWRQRQLFACLTHGSAAVASHRAAALLWELDGIQHAPLEVTVARWQRHRRRMDVLAHESKDLSPSDRVTIDGIPTTSIVRTLIDLPAVVPYFRADQAFEAALRRKLCTVDEVGNRFVQVARRGRNGTVVGRALIEKRLGHYVPTMSEFERRMSDLIEDMDLPRPQRQIKVDLPHRPAYIDLGWADRRLGIECDGMVGHADDVRLPWDEDRQNELVLLGWLILRFTWDQMTVHARSVRRQIRQAYESRA